MGDFRQRLGNLVRLLFPDSYFIRLSYPLLRELEPIELIMLCYLVNWGSLKAKKDGWFFCKMRQIMDELDLSQTKYTKTLRALKEKEYVEVKIEGWPPKRWLKINHVLIGEKMAELCEEWDQKRTDRTPGRVNSFSEEDGDMDDTPFEEEDGNYTPHTN